MARVRISLLVGVALLASAALPAAGAPAERASSTTVSGVYSITFNLSIASTLPAGTTIICRARIAPNPANPGLGYALFAASPIRTGVGLAAVTGSKATCAAEIPFAWTIESAPGGVLLSYEIDAVSNAGAGPLLLRSSRRQGIGAALPAAGQTASLSLSVTF